MKKINPSLSEAPAMVSDPDSWCDSMLTIEEASHMPSGNINIKKKKKKQKKQRKSPSSSSGRSRIRRGGGY